MSEGKTRQGSSGGGFAGLWSRGFASEDSRDFGVSLLLLVIVFLALAPGVLRYGLTWDEPTYFQYARLQRQWVGDLLGASAHPSHLGPLLAKENIARVWLQDKDYNGHPPLGELWMGLAGAPFRWLGAPDIAAFRLATALLFGLTALALFRLLRMGLSRTAAVAGVLAYCGVPAIWAHAHLGATETMQNFFWIVQAALLPWALRRGVRSLLLWLLVAALSFMGKFTNVLIPFWVLGTAALLGAARGGRFWLCATLSILLGPLLLTLIDPFFWPWQGGWPRFLDYLRQTTTRSQWVPISVFYMGRNWGFHPPWHYRLVEIAAALPLPLLLLVGPGIWFSLRAAAGGIIEGWRRPSARESDLRRSWPQILGLTGLGATLLIGWLPSTPNHDGTRQYVYVFPAIALLVGTAVDGLLGLVRGLRRFAPWLAPGRRMILTAALLLLVLLGLAASLAAEPWGLSYASEWVGGVKGAWDHGFEVSYWCETITTKMLSRLAELTPREHGVLRIHTLPKLNYFKSAGDFLDPVLPPALRGRKPLAEDVMSAFYMGWAKTERREERGAVLGLSFSAPPDAILISYRRATISSGMWDFFAFLAEKGDLELLEETRVGGVPLARLYAVHDLVRTHLPEDPEGAVWFQPRTVAEYAARTEGKPRTDQPPP